MHTTLKNAKGKRIRYALGLLLLLLALNALGGGIYGMLGAKNVPMEWLKGSPFDNYFIPGFILFTCVGISASIASIFVFLHNGLERKASFVCAIITIVWIVAQVVIIGYVSWLQPVVFIVALLILLLTQLLPKHDH